MREGLRCRLMAEMCEKDLEWGKVMCSFGGEGKGNKKATCEV